MDWGYNKRIGTDTAGQGERQGKRHSDRDKYSDKDKITKAVTGTKPPMDQKKKTIQATGAGTDEKSRKRQVNLYQFIEKYKDRFIWKNRDAWTLNIGHRSMDNEHWTEVDGH